jgi:hypothetical protein
LPTTVAKNIFYVHNETLTCNLRKKKSNKMQKRIKIFIIPYLYEAQHVSGDTPPIFRSIKLHWQPLGIHTWKAAGRIVSGRCQAHCNNSLPSMKNQRLPVQI